MKMKLSISNLTSMYRSLVVHALVLDLTMRASHHNFMKRPRTTVRHIPRTVFSCKVKEITVRLFFLVKRHAMFSRKGRSGKNQLRQTCSTREAVATTILLSFLVNAFASTALKRIHPQHSPVKYTSLKLKLTAP